jgi:hypothetical protein
MKAARHPGFEIGRPADHLAPPLDERSLARLRVPPRAAAARSEIVETLAAWTAGRAEVLIYRAPSNPAENRC